MLRKAGTLFDLLEILRDGTLVRDDRTITFEVAGIGRDDQKIISLVAGKEIGLFHGKSSTVFAESGMPAIHVFREIELLEEICLLGVRELRKMKFRFPVKANTLTTGQSKKSEKSESAE